MNRGALPPVSTREDFIDEIVLVDADTGSIWDLTGVTAKIRLQRHELQGFGWGSYGYSTQYLGSVACYGPTSLTATTENGAASLINGNEAIQFVFTEAQMATLPAGQYRLSATVARSGIAVELFQYDISILDGGVPR